MCFSFCVNVLFYYFHNKYFSKNIFIFNLFKKFRLETTRVIVISRNGIFKAKRREFGQNIFGEHKQKESEKISANIRV